jgi:hypothetical protein
MNIVNGEHKRVIGQDLCFTKVERGLSGAGCWISGTVCGHEFHAKMYPDHAKNQDSEIGCSRISKLELRRDDRLVFNWDRGSEQLPKDPVGNERVTLAVVDFLTTGALDRFGHSHDRDRREFLKSGRRTRALRPEIGYEH